MNPKEQRTFDAIKTLFEYVSNTIQEPLGPPISAGIPHLDPSAPNDTFLCRGTWRRTEPFIAAVKAALRGAPTLPAFIEQASTDRVFQIHSEPGAPPKPLNTFEPDIAVEDLWPFYLQFLEQEGIERFDIAAFERFWARNGKEILNDTTFAVRFFAVDNIDTRGGLFRVGSHVLIRSLRLGEIDNWKALSKGHWRLAVVRSVVELLFEAKLRSPRDSVDKQVDLECAFALLHGAPLGIAFMEELQASSGGSRGTHRSFEGNRSAIVTLDSAQAERLSELSERSRVARTSRDARGRRIDLAFTRYLMAIDRTSRVDAYIDVWIALEALFGGGTGEITLTLALRICAFLKGAVPDALVLYQNVKKWYKLRSDIVHGSFNEELGEDVLTENIELLRSVLVRVCDVPGSYPVELFTLEQSLL